MHVYIVFRNLKHEKEQITFYRVKLYGKTRDYSDHMSNNIKVRFDTCYTRSWAQRGATRLQRIGIVTDREIQSNTKRIEHMRSNAYSD